MITTNGIFKMKPCPYGIQGELKKQHNPKKATIRLYNQTYIATKVKHNIIIKPDHLEYNVYNVYDQEDPHNVCRVEYVFPVADYDTPIDITDTSDG
ncbi:hypothetical protein TetV_045 [Tetraselmis virus 1]|uniref:Uncharacterized protein n=1 Tax=Tetraselmis virus 1 TaxID=2060617 RepID=A0A2P0VML7_9VIRU|nr:hypothetical protein QJ968_gp045 [Tetraselmis virus 1]AUF82137.1 hypothetical protein TetV_045 [Tetraselmis virus 1]